MNTKLTSTILALGLIGQASAATIAWTPSASITGNTNEIIAGSTVTDFTNFSGAGIYAGTTSGTTTTTGFTAADYDTFLDSFNPNLTLLTLSGLTVGYAYDIQIFYSDNRSPGFLTRTSIIDGTATLAGSGEYAIGTFVADAATQGITFTPGTTTGDPATHNPHIQGYALLETVPEPSSSALLALGGLALFARRRR